MSSRGSTRSDRAADSSVVRRGTRQHVLQSDDRLYSAKKKLLDNAAAGFYRKEGMRKNLINAKHPCISRKGLSEHQEIGAMLSTRLSRDTPGYLVNHSAGSGKTLLVARIIFWWCLRWWGTPPWYTLRPVKASDGKIRTGAAYSPNGAAIAGAGSNTGNRGGGKGLPKFIFFISETEQVRMLKDEMELFENTILQQTVEHAEASKASARDVVEYKNQIRTFYAGMPDKKSVVVAPDGPSDATHAENLSRYLLEADHTQKSMIGNRKAVMLHHGALLVKFFTIAVKAERTSPGAADRVLKRMPGHAVMAGKAYTTLIRAMVRQNFRDAGLQYKLCGSRRVYFIKKSGLGSGCFMRFRLIGRSENGQQQTALSPLWFIKSITGSGILTRYELTPMYHVYAESEWYKDGYPLNADGTLKSSYSHGGHEVFVLNTHPRVTPQRVDDNNVSKLQQSLHVRTLLSVLESAGTQFADASNLRTASDVWWISYGARERFSDLADEKAWMEQVGIRLEPGDSESERPTIPTTLVIGISASTLRSTIARFPRGSLIIVDEVQKYTVGRPTNVSSTTSRSNSYGNAYASDDDADDNGGNASFLSMLRDSTNNNECMCIATTATPYTNRVKELSVLVSAIGKRRVEFKEPGKKGTPEQILQRHRKDIHKQLKAAGVMLSFVDLTRDAFVMPTVASIENSHSDAFVDVVPPIEFRTKVPKSAEESVGVIPSDKKLSNDDQNRNAY